MLVIYKCVIKNIYKNDLIFKTQKIHNIFLILVEHILFT